METNQRIGLITGLPIKSDEQLKAELRVPLPKEAIKPHPTKSYLSSIKAIYVTERLNNVFGTGAWTLKTHEIERGDKGMVVIKSILEVPDYGIYYESYGGNDNGGDTSKNFDLGDAYKGATTDGITKICSYLEIGIDVFKGLVAPPAGDKKDLPWLNEKDAEWNNTVIALRNGVDIGEVKTKFRISKEGEAKLIAQSKVAPTQTAPASNPVDYAQELKNANTLTSLANTWAAIPKQHQPAHLATKDEMKQILEQVEVLGKIKTLLALDAYIAEFEKGEHKDNAKLKALIEKRKLDLTPKS